MAEEDEDDDENHSGFTVYQKDLKSFYCRNSNFTVKSFK